MFPSYKRRLLSFRFGNTKKITDTWPTKEFILQKAEVSRKKFIFKCGKISVLMFVEFLIIARIPEGNYEFEGQSKRAGRAGGGKRG